jgi:hypothetical protein
MAAASCRDEEIMVRRRPGTATGDGAPIRAAARRAATAWR